jgi:hypothetical protein
MTVLNKILIALLALTIIGALGFVFYKERQFTQMQAAMSQAMVSQKALADNIMRSQSAYASKQDLEAFAQQNQINLDAIKSDLKTLNASVSSVNYVYVGSKGQVSTNVQSTSTTPSLTPATQDKYGYLKTVQHLAINEQFDKTNVPVGNVAFDASKEAPWDVNVYPRKYNVVNVVGTDENGKQYFYNKFSINANGKDYPLNITGAQTIQQYPDAKFSFWNPKLHMFAAGSVGISTVPVRGEFTPGISMSLMSYGKTKDKADINVLELGVGYGVDSGKPVASIMPVSVNVASIIPQDIITHTYVGPSLQIGTTGNIYVGAGVSVGF